MFEPIDISDTVNNALKNLLDGPTAAIGGTISDFLSIFQTKIHYFSEKKKLQYKQDFVTFLNLASAKISTIPAENLIEPQIQILGAISEDITYCINCEELREMFASLLSNSCNCKYLTIAHPSFSKTLKCMSPYDAVFLKKIAAERNNAAETVEAAQYIASRNNFKEKIILHECIVFTDDYFSDFNMQSLSISALKQLGVIEYTQPEPSPLERFTEIEYFKFLQKQYREKDFIVTPYRVEVYLTPYGNSFLTACSALPLSNECIL